MDAETDISQTQRKVEELSPISSLPDELLSIILNMISVNDVLNFLITAKNNFRDVGLKIYLLGAIAAKCSLRNDNLYHTSLVELRNICNLLFKPGQLYAIYGTQNGIIQLPDYQAPIYGKSTRFVKIYSDGHGTGVALTSDGAACFYCKIVSSYEQISPFYNHKMVYPPKGEKYIDVHINRYSHTFLISDKGKCYTIDKLSDIIDNSLITPAEIYSTSQLPNIKQVVLGMYSYTALILTDTKEVFGVGWHNKLRVNYQPEWIQEDMKYKFYLYPAKVLDLSNVNYINSCFDRYTFVTDDGHVYQTYDILDGNLLKGLGVTRTTNSGIYEIPGVKNIIQAHYGRYLIKNRDNYTMIELNIFLDNQGWLHFYIILISSGQVSIKGPYTLANINNIVKIFVQTNKDETIGTCSYGFVTLYGQAYVSIGYYSHVEDFLYGIQNPRLIQLPNNLRAKDITIDEYNIYLLLQDEEQT